MNHATLTFHATQRVDERCSIPAENLRQMIRDGASVVVEVVKAGKISKHLLYSIDDRDWFIAIQSMQDWGLLTVMPLGFLKNRISVRASQKRSARRLALNWEKSRVSASSQGLMPNKESENSSDSKGLAAAPNPSMPPPIILSEPENLPMTCEWKVRVRYMSAGKVTFASLGKSLPEHGSPSQWEPDNPVYQWLRQRLIEARIPFRAVENISLHQRNAVVSGDWMLEFLPLTEQEVASCR